MRCNLSIESSTNYASINKMDQKDRVKQYGKLANGLLRKDIMRDCYLVSGFSKYVNLYLNITNDNSIPVKVKVWVSESYIPSQEDLLESSIYIKPGQTYVRGPITLSVKERIHMQATEDDVVYRIMGYDERG